MRMQACVAPMAGAIVAMALTAGANGGVVNLHGNADGDTAYYEYFSDGFFRMDVVGPEAGKQSFRAISDPSIVYNPAFDGFLHDEAFRLGSVTYDESALVGGTGTATITALSLGITADPSDAGYLNYNRWGGTTTVNTFSGTVDVVANQAVSINLTSTVTLNYLAFGSVALAATGTFGISGNQFTGLVATPGFATWDFSGNLPAVPAPGSVMMALVGGAAFTRRRAR